jgi:hypothetical protein
LPHRKRPEDAGLQLRPQTFQKRLHATCRGLDSPYGAAIDSRAARALILPDPVPGCHQERGVRHEVEQIIEPTGIVSRRPTVQFRLNTQYPLPSPIRREQHGADIHRRIFWHDQNSFC